MHKQLFFCASILLLFQCKQAPLQTEILSEVTPKEIDLSETQLAYIDTLFTNTLKKIECLVVLF